MIRLILRALNAPALVILASMGVAIQTSLFSSFPLAYFQPDVVLILVIWFALRRKFAEGGILTLILGNICEIHSSAPQGTLLLSYMLIFLLVRASSRVLVLPNLSSLTLVAVVASLLWKFLCLGILLLLGTESSPWMQTLVYLLPGAAVAGLFSLVLFKWLDRFDWVTCKNARAQQILEDELQLEGEGL